MLKGIFKLDKDWYDYTEDEQKEIVAKKAKVLLHLVETNPPLGRSTDWSFETRLYCFTRKENQRVYSWGISYSIKDEQQNSKRKINCLL